MRGNDMPPVARICSATPPAGHAPLAGSVRRVRVGARHERTLLHQCAQLLPDLQLPGGEVIAAWYKQSTQIMMTSHGQPLDSSTGQSRAACSSDGCNCTLDLTPVALMQVHLETHRRNSHAEIVLKRGDGLPGTWREFHQLAICNIVRSCGDQHNLPVVQG